VTAVVAAGLDSRVAVSAALVLAICLAAVAIRVLYRLCDRNPPSTTRPREPDGVPRIRAIAQTLAAAEISAYERERGLRPLLAPIVELRLARCGVVLERDPVGAEELLGRDLAELVDPQRPRSSDRAGGGTSREAVEVMIGRLEQL
jgi:hypothetical protein